MCMWEVPYYMVLVINVARPVQLHLSTAQPCRGFLWCHPSSAVPRSHGTELLPQSQLCILCRLCVTCFEYQIHTDGFCVALPFGWAVISVPLEYSVMPPMHPMCRATVQGRVNCTVAPLQVSPKAYSESFPCVIPWMSCSLTYNITY